MCVCVCEPLRKKSHHFAELSILQTDDCFLTGWIGGCLDWCSVWIGAVFVWWVFGLVQCLVCVWTGAVFVWFVFVWWVFGLVQCLDWCSVHLVGVWIGAVFVWWVFGLVQCSSVGVWTGAVFVW